MYESPFEKLLEVFSPHLDRNNRIPLSEAERRIAEHGILIQEDFGCNTLQETLERGKEKFHLETVDGTPYIRCDMTSQAAGGVAAETFATTAGEQGNDTVPRMPANIRLAYMKNQDVKYLILRIRSCIYNILLNIIPDAEGLVSLHILREQLRNYGVDYFESDEDSAGYLASRPDKFELIERDGTMRVRNTFPIFQTVGPTGKDSKSQTPSEADAAEKTPSEKLLEIFEPYLNKNKRIPLYEAERLIVGRGINLRQEFGLETLQGIIEELDSKFLLETVDGTHCIRCLMPIHAFRNTAAGIPAAMAGTRSKVACGLDIHDKEQTPRIIFRIKTTILNINVGICRDAEGFVPLSLLAQYLDYLGIIDFETDKDLTNLIIDYPQEFELIERDGISYVRYITAKFQNGNADNIAERNQSSTEAETAEDKESEEVSATESATDIGTSEEKESGQAEGETAEEKAAEVETARTETAEEKESEDDPVWETVTVYESAEATFDERKAKYISLHKIEDFAFFDNYDAVLKKVTELAMENGWVILTDSREPQPLYVADLYLRLNFSQAVERHIKGDSSRLRITLEKASLDTGFLTAEGKHIIAVFEINQHRDAVNCQTYRFARLVTADKA